MKKTEFLPSEVQAFQMKGTQDYNNLLQLLQEEVQKIDHQIRLNNQEIEEIKLQQKELRVLLKAENEEIQEEVTLLNEKIKILPKWKETLSQRRWLEQEKNLIQAKSNELKKKIWGKLPDKIKSINKWTVLLDEQKSKILTEIQKVATNPITFCQTMRQKVSSIIINQKISDTSLFSIESKEKIMFYSQAILRALQVANLPVDETRFNVNERWPSWWTIKSNLIPTWRDGGWTYNEIF